MRQDCKFQWETEEYEAMPIMKDTLCYAPRMKLLDISNGAGHIVVSVSANLQQWWQILEQKDENMDCHLCCYECRL